MDSKLEEQTELFKKIHDLEIEVANDEIEYERILIEKKKQEHINQNLEKKNKELASEIMTNHIEFETLTYYSIKNFFKLFII